MKKSNLVGIVAGALVGRIPLIGGNYPARVTEANNFFEQFPINILGARDVRKYKTPGAKNVLVHILQKHYSVFPDTTKIEDEIKRERMLALGRRFYFTISSVQQDIFDILTYLEQEGIVDSVHVEACCKKFIKGRVW